MNLCYPWIRYNKKGAGGNYNTSSCPGLQTNEYKNLKPDI